MAQRLVAAALLAFAAASSCAAGDDTRIVILGTGTPLPDHKRSGAGVAVIHRGEVYLFDAGGGMVQRLIEAQNKLGTAALAPKDIRNLFFTHLHSDHVLDYPELAFTLWWRRDFRLRAWGPAGLRDMTEAMYRMLSVDTELRTGGNQPVKHPDYYRVDATEIEPGVVFRKGDLSIEAFEVPHGDIKPAFGYKIATPGRSIVISGDTAYSETLIEKARSVDVLIHEVISEAGLATLPPAWQEYHRASHTPTSRLASLAKKAQPKLLVLTHVLFYGASAQSVLDEVRAGYDGRVVLANDLDVF